MLNLLATLPETNSSHLKIDGWKITFILGSGPFSGAFDVSFRECSCMFQHPTSTCDARLEAPKAGRLTMDCSQRVRESQLRNLKKSPTLRIQAAPEKS